MSDEQTTVTMSLTRFKELETFEKAVHSLRESKRFLLWFDHGYTIYLENDQITEESIKNQQRIAAMLDKIRNRLRDSYRNVYDELGNELYIL